MVEHKSYSNFPIALPASMDIKFQNGHKWFSAQKCHLAPQYCQKFIAPCIMSEIPPKTKDRILVWTSNKDGGLELIYVCWV